jgi:hypothetical protein
MVSMKSTQPSLLWPVLLFLGVLALWTATPFVIFYFYSQPADAGPFGNLFGSINALFSGLAFAGLIYVVLLQRRELEFQRLELQATREEMKLARIEAERSASAQEAAARLSAITTLVEHFRSRIQQIQSSLRVQDASLRAGFRERDPTAEEQSELNEINRHLSEYLTLLK